MDYGSPQTLIHCLALVHMCWMKVPLIGIMSIGREFWLKAPRLINWGFREENVRDPCCKELLALKWRARTGHLPAALVSWHDVHCTQNAASRPFLSSILSQTL